VALDPVALTGRGANAGEGAAMHGYQITFFTQQDQRHHGRPLAEWLVHLAKELDLRGATLLAAAEGFGHRGRLHSAHFFELADQPLEVVMALSEEESERLFERLGAEGVHLFYVKSRVEFGTLGEA
jgi:PII-like signaling protein